MAKQRVKVTEEEKQRVLESIAMMPLEKRIDDDPELSHTDYYVLWLPKPALHGITTLHWPVSAVKAHG